MSRDLVAAVLLSAAAAAVADLRPPTLEDTTAFIRAAVQRHSAAPPAHADYERGWKIEAEFLACSVERRTSYDVYHLGEWQSRRLVARWPLGATDPAMVKVTTETRDGDDIYVVTLPCGDHRACVDKGALGRDQRSYFEFTSEQMAQRVAAAFRYAANLCNPAT